MKPIKNILLDFGGVLYDINYQLTIDAFDKLGYPKFEDAFSQYNANKLFEDFETGHIDEQTFYATIQAIPEIQPTITQIKEAWNAMLLGFRMKSLDFLKRLSTQYNLYLLSNTNVIHKKAFEDQLYDSTGLNNIDSFFIRPYYSHLIGLRKPHLEVFDFIVKDAGILPQETLFVEDTLPNLESAAKLGFKSVLINKGELIENKLDYLISSKSI